MHYKEILSVQSVNGTKHQVKIQLLKIKGFFFLLQDATEKEEEKKRKQEEREKKKKEKQLETTKKKLLQEVKKKSSLKECQKVGIVNSQSGDKEEEQILKGLELYLYQ